MRFSYHSKVGLWKRNAEDMEKGMKHSLCCSVPQTSDTCPPAQPHFTAELQSQICVADSNAMVTTYKQVFSKSWTCADLPGFFTILVSPQWMWGVDVVGIISSKTSCGPHNPAGLITVLLHEDSLAILDVSARMSPTSSLLSLWLTSTSLSRRKLHLVNSGSFWWYFL